MIHAIILPVATGFILFLLGMKLMETSLQTWAGPRLQLWLERFTRTPVRGLITGTVLTAALQSSTAITVIAIGLVGAGVLSFPRTLGVILGTNIGTCLTTELIGLSLGGIGVPILIASASVWLASWLAGPLPQASEPRPTPRKQARHYRRPPHMTAVANGCAASATARSRRLASLSCCSASRSCKPSGLRCSPAVCSPGSYIRRKRACSGASSQAQR